MIDNPRRNSALSETFLLAILCLQAVSIVHAATCPAPGEIKERKISKEYEWTVDESTSLDDLLTVTRLIAVSLENQSEFISCKYRNESKFIKMDGKPKKQECIISVSSGNWLIHGKRQICNEKELDQCLFDIDC